MMRPKKKVFDVGIPADNAGAESTPLTITEEHPPLQQFCFTVIYCRRILVQDCLKLLYCGI